MLPIEGGGRLVGEHELRLLDQGPADGDTLLLAARHLQRAQIRFFGQAEHRQHFVGPVMCFARRQAVAPAQHHFHLLAGGERGEEVVALEDEAEMVEAKRFALPFGHAPEIAVLNEDAAGIGVQ